MEEGTIICGQGQDAYEVTLTSDSIDVFAKASELPGVISQKGETLVAAIVALGGISHITRKRDGKLTDGMQGQPGVETFHENNQHSSICHWNNGKRDDSMYGDAAIRLFDNTGKLTQEEHFNYGTQVSVATEAELDARANEQTLNTIKYKIPALRIA